MIKSLKRDVKEILRAAPNDAIIDRIKEIEAALDKSVNGEPLNTKFILEILCECFKVKDVQLSIASLKFIRAVIERGLFSKEPAQLFSDNLNKIEFSSTESELVEEGYHQAVRACGFLVKHTANQDILTNGSVSEIVIFCFRVVNSKLAKWLRSKAARTLLSITKHLFKKLPEFPNDPCLKPSYQIRIRLGGSSSQSTNAFKELAENDISNSPLQSTAPPALRIIDERNQPYNLAFINDFFCYLASMINPSNDTESNKLDEDKILLGLQLLRVAFDEAASDIGQKTCLIHTTRNNICYNIVLILRGIRSISIISPALALAADIYIELRHQLKYQFEAFIEKLMEFLATNSDSPPSHAIPQVSSGSTFELKREISYTILELFKNIVNFPHELYYNYDCDPYSSNIYENLIQMCSKNCFQHSMDNHFSPIQITSFTCLLENLADIYQVELAKNSIHLAKSLPSDSIVVDLSKNLHPMTFEDLNEAKKRKRLLWMAIEKFNTRPKDGIQFMHDNNLMEDIQDLICFLKDNSRVDKKVLGEFLSKEENRLPRETFIRSLDFKNMRIDEALRFMLEKFRLPGESQLIERLLDVFSVHWFEQNPNILPTSDSALSLAYAIIMLNVDQHSKKVKPMTCDQFDRNLLGPKNERIYDRKLLDQIYTNIRDNEIVLPDEQVGIVRQKYLWKCTMVKSDREEAVYRADLNHGELNKILFEIMWSPTMAALSFIFDKVDVASYPDFSRQLVHEGFLKLAHVCAYHGHLDNLVVSLCKFTTDLNPIPHNHLGQHVMSDKNSLAALSLLSIIRDFADYMRDSWSNIIRNILQWYCSKCIDDVVQIDDFALQRKLKLRMREIKKSPNTMNQQSSTFLRSVYTYFAGQPMNEDKTPNGTNCEPPSAIQVLIQTIQDSVYCQESLVELITALTTTSVDGDPEETEDAEVFKLEIFTQIVLNNRDQAVTIWPKIRAQFARQSSLCGRSAWLGERIISAAFRIAILFKPKPEVFNLLGHIIGTLDAEIVRGDHTFVALMTLTELHSPTISMDAKELEVCFNQVIFPFIEKVLEGADPLLMDKTLNRAINLLSKIFLKHHKLLKELPGFALLWYTIMDTMEKYIKTNSSLKEASFELVKNMILVMDNEQCMSVEMKDITRTKFMFWEFQSGSDY